MQVFSILRCLYGVLLYADGNDSALHAEVANVCARLINEAEVAWRRSSKDTDRESFELHPEMPHATVRRQSVDRNERRRCAHDDIAVRKKHSQPRRAASIAAMSIFFICIIASKARFAAAGSGSVIACVRAIGVICQDNPHLSLHQPHALSWPPLLTTAFQ